MRVQGVPWPLAWAVLQLGWRPGWLLEAPSRPSSLFSFSPAQLTVQEGANATFTCSFSNWSEHLVLNWYRLSPSKQNIKLASFHKGLSEPGRDPRFQVTRLPNGLDFHMSVLSARCNDSGLYLCGVISLSSKVQIQETPAAELRVTDRVLESLTLEPPTAHPRPSPRPASQFPGLAVGVTSVLVGVPVVLLLAWILATTCSRAMPDSERVSPQRLEEPEAKSSPWRRPQPCLSSPWTTGSWTSSGERKPRPQSPLPPAYTPSMPPSSSPRPRAAGARQTVPRVPGL
ncbi:programmed cell death protein 1 isoform X7 [Sciurus carolinensis]|uniref:programmed cell death protein 1 isoform X7 n=1 Tax=Sciurus carolinensis TaxID=30640 RepID=UPI001FB569AA|nr:programmed cell death protein 1 isoform X7 [Sciurus carolinensis]